MRSSFMLCAMLHATLRQCRVGERALSHQPRNYTRASVRAGSASKQKRERERRVLLDDDLRPDLHAVVEVDRIDVAQADAAGGDAAADTLRLVSTVDAVHRVFVSGVEIERARAERIVRPAW